MIRQFLRTIAQAFCNHDYEYGESGARNVAVMRCKKCEKLIVHSYARE